MNNYPQDDQLDDENDDTDSIEEENEFEDDFPTEDFEDDEESENDVESSIEDLDDDEELEESEEDEESPDTTGRIVFGSIKGQFVTAVGYQENNYYVADTFKWLETPQHVIDKVNKVTSLGSNFTFPNALSKYKIISIKGLSHSGRYNLAIFTALKLKNGYQNKNIYSLRCIVDSSILSFLMDNRCPTNCIFIVRNAFDTPGLALKDFTEAAPEINLLLEQNNSILILTNLDKVQLPHEVLEIDVPKLTEQECVKVLWKHFESNIYNLDEAFTNVLSNKKDVISSIVSSLKTPTNIDTFLASISGKIPPQTDIGEYLLEKAKEITKKIGNVSNWFKNLDSLRKYFSFTVALFPDLKVEDLLKRFKVDIQLLQTQRTNLGLLGDYNFEEYLEGANCQLSNWGTVEFKDPDVPSFLLSQLKQNYFFQYWDLLTYYSKEVKSHPSKDEIETRLSYSRALGELGKSDTAKLFEVLIEWAKSDWKSVRAATGYVLRQVSSDTSLQQWVEKVLFDWSSSEMASIRWASISASERLYSVLPKATIGIIEKLSNDWPNSQATIHALVKISRIDTVRTVTLLRGWLSRSRLDANNHLKKISVRASFEILSDLRIADSKRRKDLLPLIKDLLQLSNEDCRKTLSLLRKWVIAEQSTSCDKDVSNLIASFITLDNWQIIHEIINVLETDWSMDDDQHIREIAVDLLNYYRVTSAPSSTELGILVIDSCGNSKINTCAYEVISDLTKTIRLRSFYLGISTTLEDMIGEKQFVYEAIAIQGLQPVRLVGPILERLNIENTAFVLIITAGNILDIEDWIVTGWEKKLVINIYGMDINKMPKGPKYLLSASKDQVLTILKELYIQKL